MPFDMYANGQHEAIGHQEEFIFALIQADGQRFPALSALWSAYYDAPASPRRKPVRCCMS